MDAVQPRAVTTCNTSIRHLYDLLENTGVRQTFLRTQVSATRCQVKGSQVSGCPMYFKCGRTIRYTFSMACGINGSK